MKKYFYLAGLGILLGSCGGSSTPGGDQDTTQTDSLAVVPGNIDIDEAALLAKFTVSTGLPFVQDSAYLPALPKNDTTKLTADEMRYLSFGFVNTEVSYEGLVPVEDALFFDSLHTTGSIDGYMEAVDIGMMIRSDAY